MTANARHYSDTRGVLDREQIKRIMNLKCRLFADIDLADISNYLTMAGISMVKVGTDTLLREERSKQTDIGILISGEAEIRQYDNQGTVFTVDAVDAGELFGEVTAFAEDAAWPATVVTVTDCEVLFLPIRLIADHSNQERDRISLQIMRNLLSIVASKALILRTRIEILSRNAMRSRIAVFLLQQSKQAGQSEFSVPMNREGMARYLNVSRPSMSRELGRMKDEGLITFHRNSFEILDRSRLLREAGVD